MRESQNVFFFSKKPYIHKRTRLRTTNNTESYAGGQTTVMMGGRQHSNSCGDRTGKRKKHVCTAVVGAAAVASAPVRQCCSAQPSWHLVPLHVQSLLYFLQLLPRRTYSSSLFLLLCSNQFSNQNFTRTSQHCCAMQIITPTTTSTQQPPHNHIAKA